MEAKERRRRHFRASLGSMLNENYGSGATPDTVQTGDFVYVPNMPLPASRSALKFLEHKFPATPPHKPRPLGTSNSLHNAYRRAVTQPQMMVHYDRDPLYWQGREKPAAAEQNSDFDSQLRLMAEYGKGLVPENVQPASTPSSVSSAHQSQIGSFQYDTGDIARGGAKDGVATVTLGSREKSGGNSGVNIEHNKHRLWSPGSEAAGFKPYTPFSDSLFDFGKKEAKYIPPEVEVVKEVLAVPRYYDAYRDVLGLSSRDQNGGPDILRIHGTPEYPKKVMAEADVPNYVAWAKIYPYCPLTQVESQGKPVYVPPRGFTPSVSSKPPSPAKVKDVAKIKRDVIEGLVQSLSPEPLPKVDEDVIAQKTKQNIIAGIRPKTAGERKIKTKAGPGQPTCAIPTRGDARSRLSQHRLGQKQLTTLRQPRAARSNSVTSESGDYFDPDVSRRVLDMKMKAPDVWYTGRTPTHTPTPDYTLPVKPTRAWIKHFSPTRVRHFLNGVAADTRTP